MSEIRIGLTHLLIEPISLTRKVFNLESALDDLPKNLTVRDEEYVLRGLVGFTGPSTGVGHFTAYCLRPNDSWELYDDTKSKSMPCSARRSVNCQLLFYTSPF